MNACLLAAAVATFCLDFDGEGPKAAVNRDVTSVEGISGKAAHVAETGALEYKIDPAWLSPTAGTFVIWFNWDETLSTPHFYRMRDAAEDGTWLPLPHITRKQRQIASTGSTDGIRLIGGCLFRGGANVEQSWNGIVHAGEWHQLAMTWDIADKKKTYYLDGLWIGEEKCANPLVFGDVLSIACGGGYPGFGGKVDEIRAYGRAFTREEVVADYARYVPLRTEIHDRCVTVGKPTAVRFRTRDLRTNEIKDYTRTVTADKPGMFSVRENGCVFDLVAREEKSKSRGEVEERRDQFHSSTWTSNFDSSLGYQTSTLLREYDCTKDYPADVFNFCDSEIVTNGNLVYREARNVSVAKGLVMCRFDIRNQGRAHIVEVDYPDDAARTFLFSVHPEKWGRLMTGSIDSAGILTGGDYPISNTMQTKKLVFWPDSPKVDVGVFSYFGDHRGLRPAAVSRIRLYEVERWKGGEVEESQFNHSTIPPFHHFTTRSVGIWDEDPTIDACFVLAQAFNQEKTDLAFWEKRWQRTIDYMRYQGLDTWVIKTPDYTGDATGMSATLPKAFSLNICYNGRCPGWAEVGAEMFSRSGMKFWLFPNPSSISGAIPRLTGAERANELKLTHGRDGRTALFNFLHPDIRAAKMAYIAAYRDKFSAFSGFQGMVESLSSMAPHFVSLNWGYDDLTVSLFAKETGIDVPVKKPKERYGYLTGNPEIKARWIDWRCAKVEENLRAEVAMLRAKGGKGEILVCLRGMDFVNDNKASWIGLDMNEHYRGAGIDPVRLNAIDGVRFSPILQPDYYRARGSQAVSTDEPFIPNTDSWVKTMEKSGTDVINVMRHSNLEIYPHFGYAAAAAKDWKREFWLPTGDNVAFVDNFYSYPTPHPPSAYALDSMASLVADTDPLDILHGWWGLMESGEHEAFSRFYTQFRSIPRSRFARVAGADDPVTVRSGTEGHYLVNREPYEVKVAYKVDGAAETLTLAGHEIRFVAGKGANGKVADVVCTIPDAAKAAHEKALAELEAAAGRPVVGPYQAGGAKVGGDHRAPRDLVGGDHRAPRANDELVRAAKLAREALDAGRYHRFRSLFLIGAVRTAIHPELRNGKAIGEYTIPSPANPSLPSRIAALLASSGQPQPRMYDPGLDELGTKEAVREACRNRGTDKEFAQFDPASLAEAALTSRFCEWYGYDLLRRLPEAYFGTASVRRAVERGLAGVGETDADGALAISPRWGMLPFKTGRIEVSTKAGLVTEEWRFERGWFSYKVQAPAKKVRFHPMTPYGMTVRKILVNGQEVPFVVDRAFYVKFDAESENGTYDIDFRY